MDNSYCHGLDAMGMPSEVVELQRNSSSGVDKGSSRLLGAAGSTTARRTSTSATSGVMTTSIMLKLTSET